MLSVEYPTMSHHQHKYTCSTMSSETLSGSCGSRKNRIRTIRLVKHKQGPCVRPGALGFSIRGGHEHGTGFFVSHVEVGSEAHSQGLKIGDQIIRINGFTIEDAVHKEVLQLISNHNHFVLKVRSVGMIPVKDKTNDSLSWQIISDTDSLSRSSPQFGEKPPRDVHISMMVAPRSKLGCGICKGPDWKPGIFVQFTKEGGIARDAGLRPGDQIVRCNNVDFSDIPFNEAVNLMKTSRQLDLVVRKAAASELFPGESSGYNSSASSVTEDQSPTWNDTKRLSIVKEENPPCLEERIKKRINVNSVKWNLRNWQEDSSENTYYKPTIINVTETGSTIRNNGTQCQTSIESDSSLSSANTNKTVPKIQETKTVVEVHRTNEEDESNTKQKVLTKSPSSGSFTSLASKTSVTSGASSCLSSAISLELQRRAERRAAANTSEPSIDEQLQIKKVLKGVTNDQRHQHNKLMDEFKLAHQKMFKLSPPSQSGDNSKQNVIGKDTMDRLGHKELSQKFMGEAPTKGNPPAPPPPPPSKTGPMPPSRALPPTRTNAKPKPKAPPVPAKKSVLSFHQPPPCPTPDYDTLSISSMNSLAKPNVVLNDLVEMESLDSFKMSNPASSTPKPPSTYFQMRSRLSAQLSNTSVDSSVSDFDSSMSQFPNKGKPKRLDFVNKELSQTLNRSNLRKRTESMDDLLGCQQIKPQSNGSVRISLNSSLSKELAKSTSDLTDEFGTIKQRNRITINVNQYQDKASKSYG